MFYQFLSPMRSKRCRLYWVGLLTLSAFVVSSFRFPLEPMGQPASGCRCSDERKAAGRCCCLKAKPGETVFSSDDRSSPETVPKPCCQKRSANCRGESLETKPCCQSLGDTGCHRKSLTKLSVVARENGPAVAACGCGGPSDSGFVVPDQPRMLTPFVSMVNVSEAGLGCLVLEPIFSNPSRVPETPPPEVSASRLLLV